MVRSISIRRSYKGNALVFKVDEDKEWARIFQEVVLLISLGVAVQTGVAHDGSAIKCQKQNAGQRFFLRADAENSAK